MYVSAIIGIAFVSRYIYNYYINLSLQPYKLNNKRKLIKTKSYIYF
jgi:hypothetical protein